jgi:hypothetical protein
MIEIFFRFLLQNLQIELFFGVSTEEFNATGEGQHGFKKERSTVTALKEIQSQIAKKLMKASTWQWAVLALRRLLTWLMLIFK